jgi:hypothetical protein
MDRYWKDTWVDALRSGNYTQTQDTLCRVGDGPDGENTYCCLGVLLELIPAVTSNKIEDADNEGKMILEYTYDNTGVPNCGRLPEAVTNIVELNLKLGVVGDDDEEQILIGMNDDGSTFDEIADYIEDEL